MNKLLDNYIFFSIITVCYNSEASIKKTIKSVLSQSFENYEYIIIDGNSNDETLKIISTQLSENDAVTLISEVDNGIYDAMNKGIRHSKGHYLYFLNSGDEFIDENVLANVSEYILENRKSDIYYGDILINENKKNRFKKSIPHVNKLLLSLDRTINHQSIFADRKTLVNNQDFIDEYVMCADYNWVIDSYLKNYKFEYMKIPICLYDINGISSNSRSVIIKEHEKIIQDKLGKCWFYINKFKHIISFR